MAQRVVWWAVAAVALGMSLGGCASTVFKVMAQTPASIEIECDGNDCHYRNQQLADFAQAHCQKYGANAQARTITNNKFAVYHCVAPPPAR